MSQVPLPGAAGADERCWLVNDQGRQNGPYTSAEVAGYLSSGLVTAGALVWRAGMAQWVPVTSIPFLPPGTPLPPPPPAAIVPYGGAQRNNTKVAAGLCGILLGGLGIHKFILGFTVPGLIMLLTTVLTCGWGGIITGIIGLIEGIIYLTKSDEQFNQEYVVQKKQWF